MQAICMFPAQVFFFLNKIDESSNIMFGYMYMEVITKKASKIIKDGSKARE